MYFYLSNDAEIEEKPRRNWSDDRKLDGLNLLPHVLRSRKLPELEGLDGQKATHDLAERALFWRSGSYKAIIYSNWFETNVETIFEQTNVYMRPLTECLII